ncbi:Acetyl-coenzyme A synthetase [Rhynchospora pubera]|uniref:4-coumarate--CoA ligase n=1 Tax=Rhynchospora pubera TaxID=906938 RepID=A0AAV8AKU8_9POAL|nr:Acetyl-coenzyme A synthetase [Rhynchospora pubera]KAJ4731597.1 Acetyl-coenzyme A synthetase [Rhynchospora pubera]KAJ4799306.1 Acetyl-coenzyme A synthetase [Rhynchospora pubera]
MARSMAYQALDKISSEEISAVGVPADEAEQLHVALGEIIKKHGASGPATWREISSRMLTPEQPFALHQMMYYGCYRTYASSTPPAWIPNLDDAVLTNIGRLLEKRGKEILGSGYKDPISSFSEFQKFSVSDPEGYWSTIFEEMEIKFSSKSSCILCEDASYPGGKWLCGAFLNSASNCLNVKKGGSFDDAALVWRDEGCDDMPLNFMTLKELKAQVCHVANALDTLGLEKESAIAIDMPMNPIAVIIYLAIVLAGYVVVSIADSFAPAEISTRLNISKTKAIFTQDYILRGEKELPLYRKDEYIAVEQPAEAFTNVLFSSGTTGEPKAIPWTHATPLKAAADAWSHMDIHKGDVVCWPTNLGWMMGPWLVYASLLNGASIALFNGSPLGHGFAKFIQDAKVTMLGLVPSIVRAWKNTNCTAGLDWSNIRCFSSSGEASSIDDYLWLMGRAKYKPVIEYCGGTEIGGGFVTGSMLQPQALAAFSTPAMGCHLYILGSDGKPLAEDAAGIGELALDPTFFGASTTLLNANHYDVYFKDMPIWNGKQLRRHGDEFERNKERYYRAHGRADDTMNLGGIKVSSVELERIFNAVNGDVVETAAIGVPPSGGGPEQLVVAVVLKDQNQETETLEKLKLEFNSALQKKLNPLFKVSSVIGVPALPRTASNKVMRRILRNEFSQPNKRAKF